MKYYYNILHLTLLFSWTQLGIADIDAPCYAPNGRRAEGFFPCDPTAYITTCCPTGWTCYSNSMCVVTDPGMADSENPVGTSMRGTCTNPVWNNAVCGDYCLDGGNIDGYLHACGDNKFCCSNDAACSCSSGAFNINPGIVQTIIGVDGLKHTETSTIQRRTSSSTSRSASATSITSSTTLTTVTTSTAEPTPTPVAATAKPTHNPGVKAGIALGSIVGAVLLALLVYFIYKWFFSGNRWKTEKTTEVMPTSSPLRPPSINDPYRPGNATNLMLNLPVTSPKESLQGFYDGDAPYGNEYERQAPSREPLTNSTTTIGSGTLNGGYGGRGVPDRAPSIVSEEEEILYVRPRAELAI